MLVPTRSELIAVTETPKSVRLAFRDKEWVFPREDCVLLPVENTTAELIAKYLAGKLRDELKSAHQLTPDVIRLEVEETFGQVARYEWRK
jgi:6-pyruvoyltetrahydropterin/6-carboxytetrahydropterin synthase